ncbi:NAD(P)-binding domain-containing protein [Streptomyces sp. NPDC008343]|uniref:NAD(P)-binding domain-containing protein n=1 Tax=Streptomyces sp. NPDC008343 TaxID=3364828 RepID=UPI0036E38367
MPPTPQRDLSAPTIVIGAGPHGLAAAALLNRSGEPTVILERSDRVGASWAQRYDHLRLHTTPSTSKLPGLSLPRQAGPWVSRDDYVRYLERYVAHHRLDVRVTTPVDRIERAEPGSGAQWLVHTSDGQVPTGAVVVATGRCHTPNLPRWPGRSTFTGTLLHSAHYHSPAPTAGGTSWSSAPVTAAPRSRASWPGPEPGGYGSQSEPHPTSCPAPAHDGMRSAD